MAAYVQLNSVPFDQHSLLSLRSKSPNFPFPSTYIKRKVKENTWTDYKTNSHIAKELEITPVLDKLLEYKRNWIQHVNRMPRDRLLRIMKHYSPTGRRILGRPLKRLLDT